MVTRFNHFLYTVLATLILAGCSSDNKDAERSPLLPLIEPQARADLDDRYVGKAVKHYLRHIKAPAFSQYKFIRTDLDQDGWRDALVYMSAPYGHWCDVHGCTVLVFHAEQGGFTLAGKIAPIRPPFYVSSTTTNGWRDIIAKVSGRTDRPKHVALRYDGELYTGSPESLPATDKNLHPIHINAFP